MEVDGGELEIVDNFFHLGEMVTYDSVSAEIARVGITAA